MEIMALLGLEAVKHEIVHVCVSVYVYCKPTFQAKESVAWKIRP